MKLRLAFTAAVALAMTAGCSSSDSGDAEDELTSSSESNLSTCDTGSLDGDIAFCDDPGKGAIKLTSFNTATGQLYGSNGFGTLFAVTLTGSTKFHKATLSKFIPQEPLYTAVAQYNTLVAQNNAFSGVVGIVNVGGFARVQVKNGTVKAFRPVSGQ